MSEMEFKFNDTSIFSACVIVVSVIAGALSSYYMALAIYLTIFNAIILTIYVVAAYPLWEIYYVEHLERKYKPP